MCSPWTSHPCFSYMLIQDLLCAEHMGVAMGTASSFLPCGNLQSNGSGGQLWNNYFHPPISTENSRIRRCLGGFGFSKVGVNSGWRKASGRADGETEPRRRSRTCRGTGVGSPGMGKDWTGRRPVTAVRAHVGGGAGSSALGLENSVGALPRYFSLSSLTVWSYLDLSQQWYDLRPLENQGEREMK